MRRILFAAAVTACLAFPGLAAGEDPARAVEPCVDGELVLPLDEEQCEPATDEAGPDDNEEPYEEDYSEEGAYDEDAGEAEARKQSARRKPPRFKAAFLHRVWKITGEANGFESGMLDFTAGRFIRLPRRFSSQDDAVVGADTRVLVGSSTRVFDARRHRLARAAVAAALDEAIDVTISAKLLPPAKWRKDEDGEAVPTLRAKRITIAG